MRKLILLALLLSASTAHAFCFEDAGKMYGVSPQLLKAIAKVESNFNPAAINKNKNGSYDFGLMQINSAWYRVLGEERWRALGDPCYNVKTGAWILSGLIDKYGYNWAAVGRYNAVSMEKQTVYIKKVHKTLFGQ